MPSQELLFTKYERLYSYLTMISKMNKIIAYYEEERNNLVSRINDCIQEEEYKTAHRYAKGLRLINQKLRTVCSLKDTTYDKKESCRIFIRNMEKLIESEDPKDVEYWTEYLQEQKKELKRLENVQKPSRNKSKSTVLHDTLLKLLGKELTMFSLVLGKVDSFVIYTRLARRTLIISIPQIQHYLNSYLLRKKQVRQFISLGFELYDNGDKLILFIDYSNKENTNNIENIFMKICFEILYYKDYAEESYIKYIENDSGK